VAYWLLYVKKVSLFSRVTISKTTTSIFFSNLKNILKIVYIFLIKKGNERNITYDITFFFILLNKSYTNYFWLWLKEFFGKLSCFFSFITFGFDCFKTCYVFVSLRLISFFQRNVQFTSRLKWVISEKIKIFRF